ncbi:hypothetical protein [Thiohalobacter sp.]|uniref:hypothetical protein n=1 Tax=Thiohalobacter sp. TaxID=2025948 RepID=UPI002610338F|nr:hypothetical protein [Thiohalobacter sp.]
MDRSVTRMLALGASTLLLTLPLAAPAAEWYAEPSLKATSRYDDNVRLLPENEQSAAEFALTPRLPFGRRTERSELEGVLDFRVRRFNRSDLDTNDARFDLNGYYLASERSRLTLDLSLVRDTTLDTELDDTGVVYSRVRRNSRTLSPGLTHIFNEKTRGSLTLGLTRVDYADEATTGLRDYENRSATASVNRQWSQKTVLTASLGWSRYQREDDSVRSDNTQLTLGAEHRFTERSRLSAYAGTRRTETRVSTGATACPDGTVFDAFGLFFGLPPCVDTATGTRSDFVTITLSSTSRSSGSVFGLTATHEFETGELSVDASRSITPQASGQGLLISDRLGFSATHGFTETLSGRLGLNWYRASATDDAIGAVDRTYITFTSGLRWQPRRDWSFSLAYRYRKQDREATLGSATGNVVSLALNYAWPRLTRSR